MTRAMNTMFSSRAMDYSFGRELPGLVRETSSTILDLEYDCHVRPGGSILAEIMRLSTLSLEPKYAALGCATPSDIACYDEFAASPDCWGIYYATVRVLARRATPTASDG